MADPQNPNMTSQEREFAESTRYLDEQALKWQNILRLRGEIKKAAKEENVYNKLSAQLSAEQTTNAKKYAATTANIQLLEKEIQKEKDKGTRRGDQAAKNLERTLRAQKAQQKDLLKTEGGYIESQSQAVARRKAQLEAERNLVKSINKERSVGSKIMDLFRSKEEKQRQINLARARAGGGANLPPGTGGGAAGAAGGTGGGGGAGGGGNAGKIAAGVAGAGFIGALIYGMSQLGGLASGIGNALKTNLLSPLQQASSLVNGGPGGGYGIGGGAVSGAGATSLLGGLQSVASTIPFIGGILGGLIGAFKGVVDLVLGLDQGITNFARNLVMSKEEAKSVKLAFEDIAKASGNVIVNSTRLMESQVELSKALGVTNILTKDQLQTNIELKELAGIDLETRKALAQTSLVTSKSEKEITKSVLGQVGGFKLLTGIGFDFRQVLSEAAKLTGVLGLRFSKFPEQLAKSIIQVKALGFSLGQLDNQASSFLDFESSISKEFEAQVLLGRDINLTKAREAALNNDLVTLASEITRQVGSANEYLNLNRIQQESIAAAVGMTRDQLADTLKQREILAKLGAKDIQDANEKLKIMRAQGLEEKEINRRLGEDAYNYVTQTSTAERLAELMNKIKVTFVDFVEKSGILDFITNPQKIQAFATALINRLAGAVQLIGDIVGTTLDGIASLPFTDSAKWKNLANQVRSGATSLSGGISAAAASMGGTTPGSIGERVSEATKATLAPVAAPTGVVNKQGDQIITVYSVIDGEIVAKSVVRNMASTPGKNTK